MTFTDISNNTTIRSDRYAMAAISQIFKAFGDIERSKEYWPWGETVDYPWESSKGVQQDLSLAKAFIAVAANRYKDENPNDLVPDTAEKHYPKMKDLSTPRGFKQYLNRLAKGMSTNYKNSKNIDNTSTDIKTEIEKIVE